MDNNEGTHMTTTITHSPELVKLQTELDETRQRWYRDSAEVKFGSIEAARVNGYYAGKTYGLEIAIALLVEREEAAR